jgi:hypothetical protein
MAFAVALTNLQYGFRQGKAPDTIEGFRSGTVTSAPTSSSGKPERQTGLKMVASVEKALPNLLFRIALPANAEAGPYVFGGGVFCSAFRQSYTQEQVSESCIEPPSTQADRYHCFGLF